MQFASPLAWWLAALVAVAVAGVAYLSYRRPLVPLSPVARGTLTTLRALSLAAIVILLCRPVLLRQPAETGDLVIPILVDQSRSMRIADANGEARLTRAATIVRSELAPALAASGRIELFGIGDALAPATVDSLRADARRSDLSSAIAAARDRFRGQRIPGIVLLSDGAETGGAATPDRQAGGPPIFTIGIGAPAGIPDREVVNVSASDPRLDETTVDLHVLASSRGFGRPPFQLRVLADGKLVESRQIQPQTDGAPVDEIFTVSPDPLRPTVFTAQVAAESADAIPENDARSTMVSPTGRKRRILILAGAPGYDHNFMMRALLDDPGLEIDSVVRKGKNDENADTFLVQAGGGRAAALTTGFPSSKDRLFAYDAIVIANIEGDFFTRPQLTMLAEFVSERGGGLLVFGGRSFEQRGLIGTPLEDVLPVELNDRRGTRPASAPLEEAPALRHTIVVTPEGQNHPVMRIGTEAQDTRRLWETLPPLAAIAPLGGARAGATVLALGASPNGTLLPVLAVQRYGRGRSMVFGGEAAWRWRMLQPATDRRYEFFWRQALRWLSKDAPDPVTVTVSPDLEAGDTASVMLDVRDRNFSAVSDAAVSVTLTPPGGGTSAIQMRPSGNGRFAASVAAPAAGLYRLHVEAKQGAAELGTTDRWFSVGGSDREFAEPRLNDALLRRIAADSGGEYLPADDARRLVEKLATRQPSALEPERRDLWQEPWAFAIVLALVAGEWILRRTWGLR